MVTWVQTVQYAGLQHYSTIMIMFHVRIYSSVLQNKIKKHILYLIIDRIEKSNVFGSDIKSNLFDFFCLYLRSLEI